jgi:DNA-binding CsgD family transcriptional regulator
MVLNTLNAAAITLGAKHNVLSVNRRAEALLSLGKYLHISKNRLLAKGPVNVGFSPLLSRVLKTTVPESMALKSTEVGEEAHVTVSCLTQDDLRDASEKASLLVLVTQPHHQRIATVQQLMQIFNFSPAEARLARALAHGMELEVFALDQGVKMTTIRSQMASVYNKARVKRQTDLTRVILSIPCARQDPEQGV